MLLRSIARSASQIVKLLESRQMVLKIGTSRTCCGVGPIEALADVEDVGNDEDGEDRRLADDEAIHADAPA